MQACKDNRILYKRQHFWKRASIVALTCPLVKLPITMKYLIFLALVVVAAAEDKYTSENDDLDIEAVVADSAKLKSFFSCFVDASPCDAVQADFKKDLPEAVTEACAKCTEAQKHILKRFLEGLKEKAPQDYAAFQKKFDPENNKLDNLSKAIASA